MNKKLKCKTVKGYSFINSMNYFRNMDKNDGAPNCSADAAGFRVIKLYEEKLNYRVVK